MILLNGNRYNVGNPFTDSNGNQYPGNWYQLASAEERLAVGFTEQSDPSPVDERFYYVNTDGSVTQKPLDVCKVSVKNTLASIRWSYESLGIIYNGHVYETDERSRVNYLGALIQAQVNPAYTVVWKTKTEDNVSAFVQLNATDIVNITQFGTDYISNCFTNESMKLSEIDACLNLEELLSIDLQSGWPTRVYS